MNDPDAKAAALAAANVAEAAATAARTVATAAALAASATEQWRGATEVRMRDAERRLDAINGNLDRNEAAIAALTVDQAKTRVRLGTLIVGMNIIAGVGAPLVVHYLK